MPLLAAELRSELPKAGIDSWEVLFVDDGSTDATAKSAGEEVLRGPEGRFRLLRLERAGGQSAAMEAGLRSARGRVLVVMDGEGGIRAHTFDEVLPRAFGPESLTD